MHQLKIKKTNLTPEILLDYDTNTLKIQGQSDTEEANILYPVL